MVGRLRKAHNA
jgi:hypothetical protein